MATPQPGGTARGRRWRCHPLVQETRSLESTQLLTLSVVTPKADLGFVLITPDLHTANRIEKQLSLALGADVLIPVYSYLSLTEESEYATTDEDHAKTLEQEEKLAPGSPEFAQAMTAFGERMAKYRHERVYPTLPDWPVVCFYNMTKRRGEDRNWVHASLSTSAGVSWRVMPRLAANTPARSSSLSHARAGSTTRSGA